MHLAGPLLTDEDLARLAAARKHSGDLVARGRRLRAFSRRLRGGTRAVRSTSLRTRVERTLETIRRGGLPAPGGNVWGGPGSMEPCNGCRDPIARDETELEVEVSATQGLQFHSACYRVWSASLLP